MRIFFTVYNFTMFTRITLSWRRWYRATRHITLVVLHLLKLYRFDFLWIRCGYACNLFTRPFSSYVVERRSIYFTNDFYFQSLKRANTDRGNRYEYMPHRCQFYTGWATTFEGPHFSLRPTSLRRVNQFFYDFWYISAPFYSEHICWFKIHQKNFCHCGMAGLQTAKKVISWIIHIVFELYTRAPSSG